MDCLCRRSSPAALKFHLVAHELSFRGTPLLGFALELFFVQNLLKALAVLFIGLMAKLELYSLALKFCMPKFGNY